jgi:hypothetical protein
MIDLSGHVYPGGWIFAAGGGQLRLYHRLHAFQEGDHNSGCLADALAKMPNPDRNSETRCLTGIISLKLLPHRIE